MSEPVQEGQGKETLPAVRTDGSRADLTLAEIAEGKDSCYIAVEQKTLGDRRAVLAAMDDDTEGITDYLNKEIIIVGFLLSRVNITDKKSGEIRPAVRIVLVQKDGPAIGSCSNNVIRSLQRISQQIRRPPWPQGMVVIPQQKELPEAQRMFRLELAYDLADADDMARYVADHPKPVTKKGGDK